MEKSNLFCVVALKKRIQTPSIKVLFIHKLLKELYRIESFSNIKRHKQPNQKIPNRWGHKSTQTCRKQHLLQMFNFAVKTNFILWCAHIPFKWWLKCMYIFFPSFIPGKVCMKTDLSSRGIEGFWDDNCFCKHKFQCYCTFALFTR